MKQMVLSHRIGMLKICAINFQQTCLAYPVKVLQKIRVFLPSLAVQKCDEILMYSKVTYSTVIVQYEFTSL